LFLRILFNIHYHYHRESQSGWKIERQNAELTAGSEHEDEERSEENTTK
jgi:hypothetical protein